MKARSLFGILFFVLVSVSSEAEPPPPLSRDEALSIARKENPEIRAALKKRDAVKARVSQAYTPDKPRLDVERMYAPQSGDILSNAGNSPPRQTARGRSRRYLG
ncbi:MAG TPA: hypothetical protein PKD69_06460 [Elusimicrobiota bacterium]|nr:hypothetical protein [Elusimicrobiota bacterium]